jgi:hypothetical protein
MAEPNQRQKLARELAADHAALLAERVRITDALDRMHVKTRGDYPIDELGRHLVALRTHLRRHFELEEREGYLDPENDPTPATAREARALIAQHRDFEHRADQLADHVVRCSGADVPLPEGLAQELRELLADLARHEARENELFQTLAYRDFGPGA